jgi:hypothetical protein
MKPMSLIHIQFTTWSHWHLWRHRDRMTKNQTQPRQNNRHRGHCRPPTIESKCSTFIIWTSWDMSSLPELETRLEQTFEWMTDQHGKAPPPGPRVLGSEGNCTGTKTILYVDPVEGPPQGQPLAWLTHRRPLHRVHVFWVRKAIVNEQKRYFMWTRWEGLHRVNNRTLWWRTGWFWTDLKIGRLMILKFNW